MEEDNVGKFFSRLVFRLNAQVTLVVLNRVIVFFFFSENVTQQKQWVKIIGLDRERPLTILNRFIKPVKVETSPGKLIETHQMNVFLPVLVGVSRLNGPAGMLEDLRPKAVGMVGQIDPENLREVKPRKGVLRVFLQLLLKK